MDLCAAYATLRSCGSCAPDRDRRRGRTHRDSAHSNEKVHTMSWLGIIPVCFENNPIIQMLKHTHPQRGAQKCFTMEQTRQQQTENCRSANRVPFSWGRGWGWSSGAVASVHSNHTREISNIFTFQSFGAELRFCFASTYNVFGCFSFSTSIHPVSIEDEDNRFLFPAENNAKRDGLRQAASFCSIAHKRIFCWKCWRGARSPNTPYYVLSQR